MSEMRARYALAAPSTAVFLLCFVVPLSFFLVLSFFQITSYKLDTTVTLKNYADVWREAEYFRSLVYTFAVAIAVALFVTVLAFAFAYFVRFNAGKFATPLIFVALITLFGGYLTKIYVWKTILGSTGILNGALMAMGLIDEPIGFLIYSPWAVIITLGHYLMPLAVLPIYGSLRNVADTPLRGARDLGASRWRVFSEIILPQCRIGIVFAFALSFLFAAGDYVTPLLVGGPHTSMLGVLIQFQFGMRFNAPLGAAMAFTVIAVCIAVIWLFNRLLDRALRVPA
jgi:spermidine/putrescine transport system permease protein